MELTTKPSPSEGESVKKLRRVPLTLPSPSRGEGKHIETQFEIPSPLRGEGLGGGDKGIFSHLRGGKGGGDAVRDFFATFRFTDK
jgi:hypothetical protein